MFLPFSRPLERRFTTTRFRKLAGTGLFCACFSLVCALLCPLFWQEALGAMPQDRNGMGATGAMFPTPQTDKMQALAAISGSPWPGVIDHLLQSPLENMTEADNVAGIHINYPSLGNPKIDADIRAWVETIAATFQTHLDLDFLPPVNQDESAEMDIAPFLLDEDRNYQEAAKALRPDSSNFELWGSYSISRPSRAAISITYELWNYINGDSGNLDIITLNYNLLNSQRLNFVDIFEKPDLALKLMSDWSRKALLNKLGNSITGATLMAGTEPLIENFSSLTLTPEGVCINFQPWQVASWNAGIQKVDMPLKELLASGPLLALWDKPELM